MSSDVKSVNAHQTNDGWYLDSIIELHFHQSMTSASCNCISLPRLSSISPSFLFPTSKLFFLSNLTLRRSGTHCQMNSEIRREKSTASNSSLKQSCSALTSVTSALEVIFIVMHSINPRFTYLLTLLRRHLAFFRTDFTDIWTALRFFLRFGV